MADESPKTEENPKSNELKQPEFSKMTLKELFPKKVKIVIGIDDPKEYEINPKLSFKKQVLEIPGLLEGLFSAFNKYRTDSIDLKLEKLDQKPEKVVSIKRNKQKDIESAESALIGEFLTVFRENVFAILTLVVGVKKEIIEDASNDQLIYAIDIIFKENYENSGKNVMALRDRARKIFLSPK